MITHLILVHEDFLWKPSRKSARLMALALWGRLIADCPFKPDKRVIDTIRLKKFFYVISILGNSSKYVVEHLTGKTSHSENGRGYNQLLRICGQCIFVETIAIPRSFQSNSLKITETCELDIAEQKFNYLSQCETFSSKLKLLGSGKLILGSVGLPSICRPLAQLASVVWLILFSIASIPYTLGTLRGCSILG